MKKEKEKKERLRALAPSPPPISGTKEEGAGGCSEGGGNPCPHLCPNKKEEGPRNREKKGRAASAARRIKCSAKKERRLAYPNDREGV